MSRSQSELFAKPQRASLLRFRAEHNVAVYHSKNHTLGLPWSAFIQSYQGHGFSALVEQYSMTACERKNLIAHGRDELEACRKLAELNGWEKP